MNSKLLIGILIGAPWLALVALFLNKNAIAKFLESVGASKVLDQVKDQLKKDVANVDKEIEESKKRMDKIADSDVDLEYHNKRKVD